MQTHLLADLTAKYVVILFACVWGGIEIHQQIRQRKQRRQMSTPSDRGSLVLLHVGIALGYGIAIPTSFSPYGRLTSGQPYWYVSGIVLILAGLRIRHSAMRTLASFFTYQVEIQPQHRLVETGLYRYVRHPGYLGQLLVFLGIGLALANWITVLGLLLPVLVAFLWRIRIEEDALQTRFAEQYAAYRERSWRLIPRLY